MLNQATLIGRLGKDPEIRKTESGKDCATFSVATDETYMDKNSNEKKTITDWHNLVCWGKNAEIAGKYLKKGSLVHITGKIRTRNYDDKDGIKRYVTEIIVDRFLMLGSKGDGQKNDPGPQEPGNTGSASTEPDTFAGMPEDDLPF